MGIGKRIDTWLILIVLLASTGMLLVNEGTTGENISDPTTRVYLENEKEGGEWYDDFSDSSGISSLDRTLLVNGKIHSGEVVYSENFESYTNGQNIIGSNGWTQHTNNNKGTFVCDTSRPFSSKTPKVGNHFNDQDYSISSFLSGTFLVTQGTYELWVMTSKIDSTYSTTSMNLVGKNGDNPVAQDRILDVAFSQGGFGCRGSTGNWNMLNTNLNVNTWYRVSVDFDCATQSCDVFLYGASGTLLGSEIDVGFQFPQASAKRLMLSSNTRNYDTRSYWDDIRIIDRSGTGSVISNEIDLPSGKLWSTLSLDKEEPGSSRIELEILDDSDEPITSINYEVNASEIDISGLNPGVKTIKLKANFHVQNSNLPTLNGWGVEWNAANAWRDSFQTSLKTDYLSGVEIDNGDIRLIPGQINGVYESEPITLPTNSYWETMKISMSSKSYSRILFDIIDYSTERSVPGYTDLYGDNGLVLDMSKIDPIEYPVIRIRARFNQMVSIEPAIHSISISWVGNMFPSIHGFNVTPVLMRTESTRISFGVSDTEQLPRELDVSLDYLAPSGTKWMTDMFTDLVFNSSSTMYECEFRTDTISSVGIYYLRVTVTDEMGSSRVMVYDNRLEVRNNIPTQPTIVLGPENATTRSDITATIVDPGYDVERPNLKFSYTFYINGVEDTESKKSDLPAEAVPYLPGSRTNKGDVISCIVMGSDGLNYSESYSASILIMNTPAKLVEDFVDYVVLDEDTPDDTQINIAEITYDIDGDDISFSSPGSDNITVEIDDSTGWVNFIPGPDFFGEENVTFIANDGDDEMYFLIKAYVQPINDPPTGSIISPSSNIDLELDEMLTFSVLGNDSESDPEELIYTWQIGDKVIAQGPDFTMNWTEVGEKNVSCFISDGDEISYIGSVIVNVFKPDPPYSPEEVEKNYTGSNPPVIFNVDNAFGNGVMARYGETPSIDLCNLTVGLDDYNMIITLELAGIPTPPNSDDPFTSGAGTWAYYNIYFVTAGWLEEDFVQSSLNLHNSGIYHPAEELMQKIGEESYILSYGDGRAFGSPVVDGNKIIWTLDTRILAEKGLLIDELHLWGSAKYIQVEEGLMVGGYDTIGHGAVDHPVIEEKVKTEEKEKGSPVMAVALIILILIIIGLILALVLSRKEGKEEQPQDEKAEGEKEEGDETATERNLPPPSATTPPVGLPQPGTRTLPPVSAQPSVPQQPPSVQGGPIAQLYLAPPPAPVQTIPTVQPPTLHSPTPVQPPIPPSPTPVQPPTPQTPPIAPPLTPQAPPAAQSPIQPPTVPPAQPPQVQN